MLASETTNAVFPVSFVLARTEVLSACGANSVRPATGRAKGMIELAGALANAPVAIEAPTPLKRVRLATIFTTFPNVRCCECRSKKYAALARSKNTTLALNDLPDRDCGVLAAEIFEIYWPFLTCAPKSFAPGGPTLQSARY